jgi:crossover junction endodeoxyribonuclease RuvC
VSLVYCGYDPGISNPGVVALRRTPAGYELVKAVSVHTDSKDDIEQRCNEISDALSEVIRGTHPTLLAIEDVLGVSSRSRRSKKLGFNASNDKTLLTMGIAIAVARVYRIPVVRVQPRSAKLAVLGKGHANAEKKQVQEFVNRLLGTKLGQTCTDAAALAIAGCQREQHVLLGAG